MAEGNDGVPASTSATVSESGSDTITAVTFTTGTINTPTLSGQFPKADTRVSSKLDVEQVQSHELISIREILGLSPVADTDTVKRLLSSLVQTGNNGDEGIISQRHTAYHVPSSL